MQLCAVLPKGYTMEKKRFFTPSRIIFSLLAAAVMAAIFCLSCENADESSETSGFFTDFVLRHLIRGFGDLPPERQDEVHGLVSFIIRKCAHFSAYASLGFCTSCAVGKRRLFSLGSALSWAICILYACSDELHQHFAYIGIIIENIHRIISAKIFIMNYFIMPQNLREMYKELLISHC